MSFETILLLVFLALLIIEQLSLLRLGSPIYNYGITLGRIKTDKAFMARHNVGCVRFASKWVRNTDDFYCRYVYHPFIVGGMIIFVGKIRNGVLTIKTGYISLSSLIVFVFLYVITPIIDKQELWSLAFAFMFTLLICWYYIKFLQAVARSCAELDKINELESSEITGTPNQLILKG